MDLTCPISLDIFDDPIATPCCGNAFSRQPLQEYLEQNTDCPLCRANIRSRYPEFNASAVPTNRTIANLVDAYQASVNGDARDLVAPLNAGEGSNKQSSAEDMGPSWRCHVTPVVSKNGSRLPIDRLRVEVDWPSYEGEVCLFLPVIDKSGSMSGKPFKQVKEALMHMLHQTMAHRSVFTCIIPYNSSASSIRVPRDGSAETERWGAVQQRIKEMKASGGTSFLNAFQEIKNVIFGDTRGGKVRAQAFPVGSEEYEQQRRLGRQGLLAQGVPAFVTSISIVFMTDGQDYSRLKKGQNLVNELRDILKEWTKEVVVHTVGFSRDHDFDLLDKLRKVGTKEGMFRYADPSDGDDALCATLSELTDSVVAMGGAFPVQLSLPNSNWREFKRVSEGTEEVVSTSPVENSRVVSRTILMDKGRGMADVFIHSLNGVVSEGNDANCEVKLTLAKQSTSENGEDNSSSQVNIPVTIQSADSIENNSALIEWESYLCEEIAQEALQLGKTYKESKSAMSSGAASLSSSSSGAELGLSSDFYLHAALLLQRARCLESHVKLSGERGLQTRLEICSGQISNMLQGKDANAARLNDASFSSVKPPSSSYTAPSSKTPPPPPPPQKPSLSSSKSSRQTSASSGVKSYGRGKGILQKKKEKSCLHQMVLSANASTIANRLRDAPEDMLVFDENGDSALSYAAMIGKLKALEVLLKDPSSADILRKSNKAGLCPFEVAVSRGYWKSAAMIQSAGGADHLRGGGRPAGKSLANSIESLMPSILDQGYFETAALIAGCGIGGITAEMLKGKIPDQLLEKAMLKSVEAELEKKTSHTNSQDTNWGNGYLKRACQNGMFELVSKCLEQGIVPQNEEELKQFLEFCGEHGDQGCKIADRLVQCFQETHNQVEVGLGEIMLKCATNGHAQLLEVLLRKSPQEVNYCDASNTTPLIAACAARKMECVMLLLRSSADITSLNSDNQSAIIASIHRNHCAAVASLLTAGAPLTYITSNSRVNLNIICICCESSRPEILDIILKHCDKIMSQEKKLNLLNELNDEGVSPLLLAVKHNDTACIKVLVSHNADMSRSYSFCGGGNALHYSISLMHLESVLALLENGLDVNSTDSMGRTSLHLAVLKSSLILVRMLRTFGVDLFIKDHQGKTASAYIKTLSVGEESQNLALELLDPALSPLLNASRCVDPFTNRRNCSIVEQNTGIPGYLTGSLCLDIHSGDGWTPLLEAICVGNLDFAHSLVRAGADLLKCDERGLNALFWAKAMHGEEVVVSLANIQRYASTDPCQKASTTIVCSLSGSLSSLSLSSSLSSIEGGSSHDDGEFKYVSCKGGELAVSQEAYTWMEQNFPVAAAQAFALDTLKLALTAQGFKAYNPEDEEWVLLMDEKKKAMEFEKQQSAATHPTKENAMEEAQDSSLDHGKKSIAEKTSLFLMEDRVLAEAFLKLSDSTRHSESDKQLLNAQFHEVLGVKRLNNQFRSAFSDHFHFSTRMRSNGDIPNFKTMDEKIDNRIVWHQISPCTSVLGFLQDVADSRSKWSDGADAMAVLLTNARLIAIGAVAGTASGRASSSGMGLSQGSSNENTSLSFGESFILSIFSSVSNIFANINQALLTNDHHRTTYWLNLIGSFVQAYDKLVPFTSGCVYTAVNSDILDLISFNPTRPLLYWNGFLSTTADWSKMFDQESGSIHSSSHGGANVVILCIKSKSGRPISSFSSSPTNSEVLFLPQTCFKLGDIYYYTEPISSENEHNNSLRGVKCDISLLHKQQANMKHVVIELEEI